MKIDNLISEGRTFKMKYKEPMEYINPYGIRCIEPEHYYFEDNITLSAWIEKCRRFIGINYPDDQAYSDFCSYGNMTPTDGSVARMIGILVSLKDIEGVCPLKQDTPSTAVNINQTQTQTQSQNLEFVLGHLDEEFTESQIEQIRAIINSNQPKGTKRTQMLDLLRNFGVSIGANLLTSLFIG
ncbi:MAG: hypothetical protein K2O24_03550 [Muribaculaceae bacterium]|nr:hypothetical protein [Muribaculaceae bacterium]